MGSQGKEWSTSASTAIYRAASRVAGTAAEAATADRIRSQLTAAGWTPQDVGMDGNVVACRGEGRRLILAHIDTVAESPGAIDNGAGVAVVLELARTSDAPDLCVGFPVADELGLVGSRAMARAAVEGHPAFPSGLPELTVAIDLAGQGELALMGLGPAWTSARLAWLDDALEPLPEAVVPLVEAAPDVALLLVLSLNVRRAVGLIEAMPANYVL